MLRSAEPVVLGRWHRVMAERVHKDGTLVVDGGAPVQRSSPGKSQGLNLRSPLYLGGTEPPLQPPTNASFQGCIGEVSPGPPPHTLDMGGERRLTPPSPRPVQVSINGKKVDLSYSFLRSRGVGQCGQSSPCLHAPCLHGGRCLPLPDGSPPFRCLCPPGFSGERGEEFGRSGGAQGVRAVCTVHACVCHAVHVCALSKCVLHASAAFVCVQFACVCCVHLEHVHASCVCCACALCMFVSCVGMCRVCICTVCMCALRMSAL